MSTYIKPLNNMDVEMILKLRNFGPSVLDSMYNTSTVDSNFVDRYHKLYVFNKEIFGDTFNKYIEYDQYSDLLTRLTYLSTNLELVQLIDEVVNYSKMCSFQEKIKLYTELFNNSKFTAVIKDSYCWFNEHNIDESLLGDLLCSVSMENEEQFVAESEQVYNIMYTMLKNKDLRSSVVNWIAEFFNKNIRKINYQINEDNSGLSTDTHLVKTMYVLFLLWKNGVTEERIMNIKSEYITDAVCPIKWMDKHTNSDNIEYGFMTQSFFLLMNGLRVVYIPILKRVDIIRKYLIQIENERQALERYANMFTEVVLQQLNYSVEKYRKILREDIFLVNNSVVRESMNYFCDQVLRWITTVYRDNRIFCIDDTLSDIHTYIIHDTDDSIPFVRTMNFSYFVTDIINTDIYTKNPGVKWNFFNLIVKERTVVGCGPLLRSCICVQRLVDDTTDNSYLKLLKKKDVYNEVVQIGDDVCRTFPKKDLQKFVNIFLDDIFVYFESSDPIREMLDNNEYHYDNADVLYEVLGGIAHMVKFTYALFDTETFKELFMSDEFINKFTSVITLYIKMIANDYGTTYKYINEVVLNRLIMKGKLKYVDLNLVLKTTVDICRKCVENDKFVETLVLNTQMFKISYFEKILDIIDDPTSVTLGIDRTVVEQLIDTFNSCNQMDTDTPEQFLDPLTCCVIKTPVLLPNMEEDMFFERSVIVQSLLNKEENPFNRERLTIEELDEYNNRESTVEKLNKFNEQFNEWQSSKN